MSKEEDTQRLSMSRHVEKLTRDWPGANMVTLYLSAHALDHRTISMISPLLVPSRSASDAIKTPGWLSVNRSPEVIASPGNGHEHLTYHRFGSDDGIEPLVVVRNFHGLKESYIEVSEEFRLFHNLCWDKVNQKYVKIDDSGEETVAVDVSDDRVQFRIHEVRQYLAIREMHLLVQFEFQERSQYSLADLSLAEEENYRHDDQFNWRLYFTELGGIDHRAFARFIGKRLVGPVEKRHSGFGGFSFEAKRYVDFIIGQDDQGRELMANCNPSKLPRYTGKHPEFFTPVYFRKSVLDKYYSQPSKFRVSDGLLSCGNLWMLSFDDDHDDWLCAWLGDLGDVLPHKEQQHWKAHNFVAIDIGISRTFFDRQFAGEFSDSGRPEHQFRALYVQLAETCTQRLGWPILLPLHDKDAHRLASMRVPGSDEQPALDEQLQGLATILVDSLNVSNIRELVPQLQRPDPERGIDLLESLFQAKAAQDYQTHIDLLRTVQNLRSSGSAHRKGRKYDKIATDVRMAQLGPRGLVTDLIKRANEFLRYLIEIVESDALR